MTARLIGFKCQCRRLSVAGDIQRPGPGEQRRAIALPKCSEATTALRVADTSARVTTESAGRHRVHHVCLDEPNVTVGRNFDGFLTNM